MNDKPKRDLATDLTAIAKGQAEGIPVDECARMALVSLAVQKRLIDHLRGIAFAEAAWLLRELEDEGIDDRNKEKLRLCATRLSDAARTIVRADNEQEADKTVEPERVEKKADKTAESLDWD